MRTRTRMDVGHWLKKRPVWLCIMPDELVLFAIGRRRYAERISWSECRGVQYHHETGELVFDSDGQLRVDRLAMSLEEALRILKILKPLTKPETNKKTCSNTY